MSTSQSNPTNKSDLGGLVEGLRDKGWIENKNLLIDYRFADNDPVRALGSIAELVNLNPDLIFSGGTVALNALRESKLQIPIVFANVTDPVAGGYVTSLAHPGGNITGFTPFEYDIGGKWLQLLRDAVPGMTHVTMLGDPANHNFAGFQRSFLAGAKSMNLLPVTAPIRSVADIEQAIQAAAKTPNGGLVVTAASFSVVHRDLIVSMASKFRLPAIYWNLSHVEGGGLMSYGPPSNLIFRASADYVDKILKGAKPADLPVQSPTRIDLTINLKTAKALGISIPQSVLLQANEVIR